MSKQTTHTGVFLHFRYRAEPIADGEPYFIIGYLEDGTCVKGNVHDGELTPGITYEFYGRWKDDGKWGKQFHFSMIAVKQPHGRHGVVAYLARYAPGIGPAVAARLWDAFGSDAVAILRTQPESVLLVPAVARFMTLEKAQKASAALRALAELEDTKIELTNLFAGRGFPFVLIEECIKKWRIMAPARIKRDPFCLLVEEMSGCGWARVDRLYLELGLPPFRIKRQVMCLWHVLKSDTSGHTWIAADVALQTLGEKLVEGTSEKQAEVNRRKAILLGCRAGWLARRRDSEGKLWLAEAERAENEKKLAERLVELGSWEFTEEGNSQEGVNEPQRT